MATVRTDDAPEQKTGWNVYTMMLLISLLLIILAIICLVLELKAYNYDWKARTAEAAPSVVAESPMLHV
jgi:hypothetical protein